MKDDTDQRLSLGAITEEQVAGAMRAIIANANTRDELELFMRMIAPAPHTVGADPSDRRATPRWDQ